MKGGDVQRGKAWGILEYEQHQRYGGWSHEGVVDKLQGIPSSELIFSHHLMCPYSNAFLSDPVVAEDGCTYQRNAIHKYFEMLNNSKLYVNVI